LVSLPKEKTKPLDRIEEYLTFLYGVQKIGKSTFGSMMDDPLFIATEPGLNALSVFAVFPRTWKEMLEVCAELDKSKDYKTIVIDTIDNAYDLCLDHVCKEEGIKHPEDMDYGKGWSLVKKEFQRVITKLAQGPRGLLIISHAQDQTIKSRTAEVTKAVPTIGGSARRFILGLADIILYAEMSQQKEGMRRVLHAAPSESWEAGDRTGRLPAEIPLDWPTVKTAFEKGGK
jgi:hypothetical protein